MKVYVTKFALTKGIFPVEAAIVGDRAVVQGTYPWERISFAKGDWHREVDKALARAYQMAKQKVSYHEAEAARFGRMEFTIQEEL